MQLVMAKTKINSKRNASSVANISSSNVHTFGRTAFDDQQRDRQTDREADIFLTKTVQNLM